MKKRSAFQFLRKKQVAAAGTASPIRALASRVITMILVGMCGFWAVANPTNSLAQSPTTAQVPRIRLAIGALGGRNAEESKELADLLAARLASAEPFELVERHTLEAALQEQALSFSGLVRAKDAVRVGHLARADWFLLGSSATVNGTNNLFLRIVDARSSTIRNVGVFTEAGPLSTLAEEVAQFVIRAGTRANNPLPAAYLAVGAFQDTGVNNRYTNFPTQVRAYLAKAYQGSQVTVLEREAVEPLFQELRMDIAGLTEISTNAATAQAAFWLVDGFYQSYEMSGPELDLALRVERVSGRRYLTPLRGQLDDQLLHNVKAAIDVAMAKNDPVNSVSNFQSEVAMQLARGEKLLGARGGERILLGRVYRGLMWSSDLRDDDKIRQNIENAKRAFETVLLLDPENREAKMDLATCLRYAPIADLDQARSLYREIIGDGAKDVVADEARAALAISYTDEDFQKEAELGRIFAAQCTDPYSKNWCNYAMGRANEVLRRRHIIPEDPLPDPEQYITSRLQEITEKAKTGPLVANFDFGIYQSVYRDPQVAADHINQVLPKLEAQFPALKPYLLYQAMLCQADTNSPLIGDFLKSLDSCLLHPEKTGNTNDYFHKVTVRSPFNKGLNEVAARIGEARLQAVRDGWAQAPDDPRKVEMAYVFMATRRWKQALDIFEAFGNRVVNVGNLSYGPWGSPFDPFIPARAAEECRAHLGIAAPAGNIEFKLGEPLAQTDWHFGFAPAGDSAWVASRNQLWFVDAAGQRTKKADLPTAGTSSINCMVERDGKLWMGTEKAGLIEYDVASGTLHQYTIDDGLMLNSIVCLLSTEDALWIGYGYRDQDDVELDENPQPLPSESGGVGKMDLKTHHFSALTPPLRTDENQPRGMHFDQALSLPRGFSGHPPDGVGTNGGTNGFRFPGLTDAERMERRNRARHLIHGFMPVEPPRNRVVQLAPGRPGEMLMAIWRTGIESYNITSNSWDIVHTPDDQNRWSSLALREGQIIGGISDATVTPETAKKSGLGMHVFDVAKDDWRRMAFQDELPANDVMAVALSGSELWIGGKGFVAVADLEKDKLLAVCHFIGTVQTIEVENGYAWIQLSRDLYRVSVGSISSGGN